MHRPGPVFSSPPAVSIEGESEHEGEGDLRDWIPARCQMADETSKHSDVLNLHMSRKLFGWRDFSAKVNG
jgi:hypothetical protein